MENAFCHNAICTPSRACIMTGQYSATKGWRDWSPDPGSGTGGGKQDEHAIRPIDPGPASIWTGRSMQPNEFLDRKK